MDLDPILRPRSLAVVGYSHSNPFHPANVIYHKNHLRYDARCFAVNPRGGEVYGETVYPRIGDIPGGVDQAVLVVRSDLVPGLVRECAEAGVRGLVVISGGFAETGRTELQAALTTAAHDTGLPVIGPNCLGVYAPPMCDSFFLPYERLVEPRAGNVALVSQSGGILVDLIIKLTQERVGLSSAVSIGNKAVVDEVDLLEYFLADEQTQVIGIYLEGFSRGRGRRFVELARSAAKPIVALKAGKTPGGSRAVSSHTASLAGDYRVFRDLVGTSGVLEARDDAEFVAYCEALSVHGAREGGRVAIVTASGGHGAVASDGCFVSGLELPVFPAADQEALRADLSPSIRSIASLANPIDLTGSAIDSDVYAVTRFALERDDVDAAILLLMPYLPALTADVGARVAQIARYSGKPVVAYVPHVDKYGIFIEGFEFNGIPVSQSVEGAVQMARASIQSGGPR